MHLTSHALFSNHTGKSFTSQDFAEWYSCPHRTVLLGEQYSDPLNWGGSYYLEERRRKWYFIGVNTEGIRVKGEAIVIELASLAEQIIELNKTLAWLCIRNKVRLIHNLFYL